MPPRCHRRKCARKYPQAIVPSPRPCVDSLHLPLDVYLPHHMCYPPPYYHAPVAPVIRHEYICECPESPTISSHSSVNCMAANHNRPADKHTKKCPGNCTPPEVSEPIQQGRYDQYSHNENIAQGQAQVPYTPSINRFNEQPPQYPNDPESSRTDRQRYAEKTDQQQINFEERERVSYPPSAYQQMTRAQRSGYREQTDSYPREVILPTVERNTTHATVESDQGARHTLRPLTKNPDINAQLHQSINPSSQQIDSSGQHHFHGPPPQYTDAIDVSLPHYSLPPSSCCKNSARFSDSQRRLNSERTPSPQNNNSIRRYQESTPDPVRRYQDSPPRHPMASHESNSPPCCANAFNRKKDDKPPLSKGMSGAHRPGFVFNESTQNRQDLTTPKGCMSNGTSCSHGITSIMPNVNTHLQEKNMPQIQESASTCSCKESKKVKEVKSKGKKEAGTDVSHSASHLPDEKKFCSCIYPPAFGQFSCSGNIMGSCMCNEQNFQ